MLKILLLFSAALICASAASAQTHQRRVLIEEFTNASSGPDASQNPAFNAVVAANADYLSPIKYQTVWPGVDPMNAQNPTDVATRVTYYNVTGVPNGRQNGTFEVFPMPSYTAGMIQAAYNTLTPVTMAMSHSLSANYDSVLIHVDVTSDDALTGTLRLRVAVVEEEIHFDVPPGSSEEKDFFHVMRKMLPDADGTVTGDFVAGETKSYDLIWPIGYAYDLNKIAVIAWIQEDGTREVFQSARSVPIGGIPTTGIRVNSGYSFNCIAGTSPKITLTNIALTNLTSATLRYRINNGTWIDYNWTGNLALNASAEITLTNIGMNQTGTTIVDVDVINSNNGIKTNLINAISTINIGSLLDPAAAIPFQTDFQASTSIPSSWTVINPPGTNGWKISTASGANSTNSALCDMYSVSPGNNSVLTSPKIDLTQAVAYTSLQFDHAYTYYDNTEFDSLRIEISENCGETWTTFFHNGKDGLATVAPTNFYYVPNAADWRNNEVDLTSYNGNEIIIRFVGESGSGNNLWIDNIKVINCTPTLTGASQAMTVCAGSGAVINLTGLQPNSTSALGYTIDGVAQTSVTGIVADGSGAASFISAALTADNNGQTLQITHIEGNAPLSCSASFAVDVTLSVNNTPTPAVSIEVFPSNSILSGTSVTFTAAAGNTGGGTVNYNFNVNGCYVQSGPSNTYSTTTLSNFSQVSCDITVTGGTCLTSPTAFSNTITMTVSSNTIPPMASIEVSPSGAICAGTPVTFTATAGITGGTVNYTFKVNGASVQTGASNSYTTTTLENGDQVACDITVSIDPITMTVNTNAPLMIQARAFLQGPYVSTAQLMHDSLRTKNLIPLSEPYTGLPNFTHTGGGGGEQTTPAVLAITGPDAIVDWVFLELRGAANPAQALATRSALLQRDGDVVEVDGVSPVAFGIPGGQSYSLAVRHRNHLGVQLGAPTPFPACGTVTKDFQTTPPEGFYAFNGLNPAEKTINSTLVLWAGNGQVDYLLKYNGSTNDRNAILSTVGLTTPNAIVPGYLLADYNLDGLAKYNGSVNDRNVLLGNVGITTPSAILYDQIGH